MLGALVSIPRYQNRHCWNGQDAMRYAYVHFINGEPLEYREVVDDQADALNDFAGYWTNVVLPIVKAAWAKTGHGVSTSLQRELYIALWDARRDQPDDWDATVQELVADNPDRDWDEIVAKQVDTQRYDACCAWVRRWAACPPPGEARHYADFVPPEGHYFISEITRHLRGDYAERPPNPRRPVATKRRFQPARQAAKRARLAIAKQVEFEL